MAKKLAYFLSVVFHPVLLPTWLMVVLAVKGHVLVGPDNHYLTWYYMIVCFVVSFVIPVLAMLLMKKVKAIDSFDLSTQRERLMPLLSMSIFFYTTYYVFKNSQVNIIVPYFLLVSVLLCAVAVLITMRWKISLHTLGWGAFVACLGLLSAKSPETYMLMLGMATVVAGAVASARLYLGSHSPAQIYAGFGVGLAVGLLPLLIIGL